MTFKEQILFAVAAWNWWQRYVVTIFFLLMLISCWWFLCYRAIGEQRTQAQAQIIQLQASEPELEHTPETPHTLDAEFKPLIDQPIETVFEQRKAAFLHTQSLQEISDKLLNFAQLEGLSFENYELSPAQTKEWYVTHEVHLGMLGEFFKLINFFERLQKYDNIIVQECHMVMLDAHEESILVRCTCKLSIVLAVE